MITLSNALINSLAYLQTQQKGHKIFLPKKAADGVDLKSWCAKHGLSYWINGRTLTLQLRQDGENYSPTDGNPV